MTKYRGFSRCFSLTDDTLPPGILRYRASLGAWRPTLVGPVRGSVGALCPRVGVTYFIARSAVNILPPLAGALSAATPALEKKRRDRSRDTNHRPSAEMSPYALLELP